MHPSDSRLAAWADSTGMTNFIVGMSPDSSWPMAEWKFQTAAAPWTDTTNRITFNLTAAQAATPLTLRIGITRLDHGRPNISVNGGSSPAAPPLTPQPVSRGLTLGNWRGNNSVYTFNLSTSSLRAGTNTIDIFCVSGSGSGGEYLSPWFIYDAVDLVTTSSLTNAPIVRSITVTPTNSTLPMGSPQTFTATARDQFGNVTPANFTWSATGGTINGAGSFVAPSAIGSFNVTATSGVIAGAANVNVTYIPGDFNSDASLTAADLPAMLSALADLTSYRISHSLTAAQLTTIGDLNGDGRVSNADIQALLDALITAASGGSGASATSEAVVASQGTSVTAVVRSQLLDRGDFGRFGTCPDDGGDRAAAEFIWVFAIGCRCIHRHSFHNSSAGKITESDFQRQIESNFAATSMAGSIGSGCDLVGFSVAPRRQSCAERECASA